MTDLADTIDNDAAAVAETGRRPTLTLDVALYDRYLEHSGLSDEDRHALLEALWAVIVGFVDLGFTVEPAAELAEQLGRPDEELAPNSDALLDYAATSATQHFELATTSNTSSRP